MKRIYSKEQIQMEFASETVTESAPKPLEPIVLPSTDIKLMEQFALALQTRDADLLGHVISKNAYFSWMDAREPFVKAYLRYCNQLERKHGKIYVQTVNGSCQRATCNRGKEGLAVTVFSMAKNKLLWSFNLVAKELADGTLDLWKCPNFGVDSEGV